LSGNRFSNAFATGIYRNQAQTLPISPAWFLLDRYFHARPQPVNIVVVYFFPGCGEALDLTLGSRDAALLNQVIVVELAKGIQTQGKSAHKHGQDDQ
jgi:hypothetical protein